MADEFLALGHTLVSGGTPSPPPPPPRTHTLPLSVEGGACRPLMSQPLQAFRLFQLGIPSHQATRHSSRCPIGSLEREGVFLWQLTAMAWTSMRSMKPLVGALGFAELLILWTHGPGEGGFSCTLLSCNYCWEANLFNEDEPTRVAHICRRAMYQGKRSATVEAI